MGDARMERPRLRDQKCDWQWENVDSFITFKTTLILIQKSTIH